MNAIKLPVVAIHGFSDEWFILESNNRRLGQGLTEEQARQIAIALNSHDALVEALKVYAELPSECWNRVMLDTVCNLYNRHPVPIDGGDIARAALAKVEDLQKNQHQTT